MKDKNEVCSTNPETITYGTESILFVASKIWSIEPQGIEKFLDV